MSNGGKRKASRAMVRANAARAQRAAMIRNSTMPIPEAQVREVMDHLYTQVEVLRTGDLDSQGFLNVMVKFLYVADNLAQLMVKSDTSGQIYRVGVEVLHPARDALNAIGERHSKLGKYVAKGDEYRIIREFAECLEQMMALCTIGILVQAESQAIKRIEQELQEVSR